VVSLEHAQNLVRLWLLFFSLFLFQPVFSSFLSLFQSVIALPAACEEFASVLGEHEKLDGIVRILTFSVNFTL